jgi:hypothetical protein
MRGSSNSLTDSSAQSIEARFPRISIHKMSRYIAGISVGHTGFTGQSRIIRSDGEVGSTTPDFAVDQANCWLKVITE